MLKSHENRFIIVQKSLPLIWYIIFTLKAYKKKSCKDVIKSDSNFNNLNQFSGKQNNKLLKILT